jgi:hypothetical protein
MGQEIAKYMGIYGVYTAFWPTLLIFDTRFVHFRFGPRWVTSFLFFVAFTSGNYVMKGLVDVLTVLDILTGCHSLLFCLG